MSLQHKKKKSAPLLCVLYDWQRSVPKTYDIAYFSDFVYDIVCWVYDIVHLAYDIVYDIVYTMGKDLYQKHTIS
jgi:hypothetical protein